MKGFFLTLFILVLVVGGIGCHVTVWNECRATHSWLYCVTRH